MEINRKIKQLDNRVRCLMNNYYDSFSKFPKKGRENTLYIDKQTGGVYVWENDAYITSASMSLDIIQALTNANNPSGINPFLTLEDTNVISIDSLNYVAGDLTLSYTTDLGVQTLTVALGSLGIKYNEQNFTALSLVTGQNLYDFAYLREAQGTKWLPAGLGGTYYGSGLYMWDGSVWANSEETIFEELNTLKTTKQNTLIAGTNISIVGNTISASGGSVIVPVIKATTEILATSKTQVIPIYGFDLNKITSISLTDASAINISTDLLIVNNSYAELTVTMNATVGLKTLTVNGTIVYTNWINSKVKAGFDYLGSADGASMPTFGVAETTDLRIFLVPYPPTQTTTGIKAFEQNGMHTTLGFTKWAISKNETLDVIFSSKAVASNLDVMRFFMMKKSDTIYGGITVGNDYGKTIAARGFDVNYIGNSSLGTKTATVNEVYYKDFTTSLIHRAYTTGQFEIGALEATTPSFVRIRVNDTGFEVYSLADRYDTVGHLIYKNVAASNAKFEIGELYTFFFGLAYGTAGGKQINAEIVAIRKS